LETLASKIASAGGSAEATPLDAPDAKAVERHTEAVVSKPGGLDISFNLVTVPLCRAGTWSTETARLPSPTISAPHGHERNGG